jgi:hypothetical protein
MDSGPGAYAPSRNDPGYDSNLETIDQMAGRPSQGRSPPGPYLFSVNWISG